VKRFLFETIYGLINSFTFIFALILVAAPVLVFIFVLFLSGLGASGSDLGEWVVALCALSVPMTVGIYLLMGGSSIDKATHQIFGRAVLLLLVMAGGIALLSPADFDLDVIWKYLLIFGGVAFGILGFGYLRAPKNVDAAHRDEPLEREPDDRLR
jgi:hypothetical protein